MYSPWTQFPSFGRQVEAFCRVLVNDEGRWVGSGTALALDRVGHGNTDTVVLHGEGGDEGWTAYV